MAQRSMASEPDRDKRCDDRKERKRERKVPEEVLEPVAREELPIITGDR